jgi:hypothetical protein
MDEEEEEEFDGEEGEGKCHYHRSLGCFLTHFVVI